MTSCIYGSESHPEGTVICVNGRGLKCLAGEWRETGTACDDEDGVVRFAPKTSEPESGFAEQPTTKAKR